jgi:hypothetical protein
MTRTRTLSAAKGRAPGPLLNDKESDGSFSPLNLDSPGGGDTAGHSESERGSYYLSIASFLSAVPLPPAVISRVFRLAIANAVRHGLVSFQITWSVAVKRTSGQAALDDELILPAPRVTVVPVPNRGVLLGLS